MPDIRQLHPPKGWFRAVIVHDATAHERDGEPFYELNELPSTRQQLLEVRFADAVLMLAEPQNTDWPSDRGS